jgi:hypothetical protein
MNEEIEKISARINNFINYEVDKARQFDVKYKNLNKQIIEEIERHIKDAVELVEDYREQKLTLNQLEAEGGLRALIQLRNDINECIL